MNLRMKAAAPVLAISIIFGASGCAVTTTAPGDAPSANELTQIVDNGISSYENGKRCAEATGQLLPVDLRNFVIGQELVRHMSDDGFSIRASVPDFYFEANGWNEEFNVNLFADGLKDAERDYINTFMAHVGALEILETKNPELHEAAIADIENMRKTMVTAAAEADAKAKGEHTHDVNGVGTDGTGRNHVHRDVTDPNQISGRGQKHSHGNDFGAPVHDHQP